MFIENQYNMQCGKGRRERRSEWLQVQLETRQREGVTREHLEVMRSATALA